LRIEEVWEELMGKTIAKYTDKIQIINHTLYISSSVAPLKNELLYQKEKIIERINEALGEKLVKDVVIKVIGRKGNWVLNLNGLSCTNRLILITNLQIPNPLTNSQSASPYTLLSAIN
jgi:predicted nucleic acid-binding Zn ribbon protein